MPYFRSIGIPELRNSDHHHQTLGHHMSAHSMTSPGAAQVVLGIGLDPRPWHRTVLLTSLALGQGILSLDDSSLALGPMTVSHHFDNLGGTAMVVICGL